MKRFINRHYSLVRPHLTFIYTWYIDLTCKQCNITKLALFVLVQKKMKKTKEKKGALETKACESPAAKKPKREKMNTSDVNGNTDTSHIKVMNLHYCQCLVTLMMSHVNTVQMLMGRRQSFTSKSLIHVMLHNCTREWWDRFQQSILSCPQTEICVMLRRILQIIY